MFAFISAIFLVAQGQVDHEEISMVTWARFSIKGNCVQDMGDSAYVSGYSWVGSTTNDDDSRWSSSTDVYNRCREVCERDPDCTGYQQSGTQILYGGSANCVIFNVPLIGAQHLGNGWKNVHCYRKLGPLEKLIGFARSATSIELWDGTILTPNFELQNRVGEYVLFEGYRATPRGSSDFFITHLYTEEPFGEIVERPAIIDGTHTALVVRLIVNGVSPDATRDQIRSEVFGVDGDSWNINLFERCSHGSYKIVPFTGLYGEAFGINDGVMDLELSGTFSDDIHNLKRVAIGKLPYDNSVDFILFVTPDGYDWGNAAGRATLGGRYSLFNNDFILNPFVVGHELGHNLGLHHSSDQKNFGAIGKEYGDHTCLMGNGYIDEDKDFDENTHCFNNAKNWQLGWYANRRVEYSHSLGSIQAFDLVGLGDYALSDETQAVVLKVGNFYIGFNRISGVSSDVQEYQDLVTIQEVDASGKSHLVAHKTASDFIKLIGASVLMMYVESIEIKPVGQASVARIVLGTPLDVEDYIVSQGLPASCTVDQKKSAATCTEKCGSVPAIPVGGFFGINGGNACPEYDCYINDGLCKIGGKCDEDSYLAYVEKLELIPEPVNGTNHICEALNQVSENVFSNFTCFLEDSQVMISDFVSVCAYDFSSTSQNDEETKIITFSVTYTIEETSNPERPESATQFSNTTFAQNVADLLGLESVVATIDKTFDIINVTIETNQYADLEDRVKHEWFLLRLQVELEYDFMFIDDMQLHEYAQKTTLTFEKDSSDESFDNMLLVAIAAAAFVLFTTIIMFSCWCCGNRRKIQDEAKIAVETRS